MIRSWTALGLIGVGGAIAVRYATQSLGQGPGDNDPDVISIVALVANFIGFVVRAFGARLIASRG